MLSGPSSFAAFDPDLSLRLGVRGVVWGNRQGKKIGPEMLGRIRCGQLGFGRTLRWGVCFKVAERRVWFLL